MSGPLCDAVLERSRSGRVLEDLERSNLMLVPLDRRRRWYRYHTLFQELLFTELEQRESEVVTELHRRAAAWWEANGAPEAAVYHAQAAGDAERVAELVARLTIPTYAQGRLETVRAWFAWFDDNQLVDHYPPVAVLGAVMLALMGQPAAAERWAAVAESRPYDGELPDGSPMSAWLAQLRALLCRDGVEQMRRDAEVAYRDMAPGSVWQASARLMEGASHLLAGDLDSADVRLAHAVDLAEYGRRHPALAIALAERAIIAIERQDWSEAAGFVSRSLDQVREANLHDYGQNALVYALAARVALHDGDLARARDHVASVVRLRPHLTYALPHVSVQALLELARAYVAMTDAAGARAVLRDVRDIVLMRPRLGTLPRQADELRAQLAAFDRATVGASSLTTAELRLIPLLSTHLTFPEIGERLFISRHTVKTQALSIYRKLGASSRSEAIERAQQIGLLDR
jgi:LuxR family maltose regulon positive regulatory protein